jgi:ABC-type multidrug transport system fused ATPase/permease subunit
MEIQNIQSAVAGVKLIDEFLADPPSGRCRRIPNTEKTSRCAPVVCFDHVRFGYDDDSDVLQNLSFTVSRGEAVTFVRQNRRGQEHRLRLLLGLVPAA